MDLFYLTGGLAKIGMNGYFLSLAWRSFRKEPWIVVLIALILGAGTGLFTTTYSLLSVLGGDPIPQKSELLLRMRMGGTAENGEPVELMSSDLVQAVRKVLPGVQVVATTSGFGSIEADRGDRRKMEVVRFSDPAFFEAFDVPILEGRAWTTDEDVSGARVVVVGRRFAQSMFGTTAVIGRSINIGNTHFQIIGVLDDWQPAPRYYDLSAGAYVPAEQIFLPLSSVRSMDGDFFMTRLCPVNQAEIAPHALADSACSWLSVWGVIGSISQRHAVQSRMDALLQQWRSQEGWPISQSGLRIENVGELLRNNGVVPGGAKTGVLLAIGFLLLCTINAAGLLLAKCLRRSQEIGIRRALGASRLSIAQQFMVEAGLIGLASGMVGVVFAAMGAEIMQRMPKYYMQFAEFSLPMLGLATATSIVVGLAAGLFPAWRASQIEPAIQIKVD